MVDGEVSGRGYNLAFCTREKTTNAVVILDELLIQVASGYHRHLGARQEIYDHLVKAIGILEEDGFLSAKAASRARARIVPHTLFISLDLTESTKSSGS